METKCEDCNIKMSSNVEVKAHIKNEHADAIKKAFSKEVMSRVPSQSKYLDWLKKDHIVEIMTPKQNVMNKEQLKEITNHNASCFEMTKERECEGDIFETQRTILVPQKKWH